MTKKLTRMVSSMDLEEQILNIGSAIAVIGVFLPWAGGEWLGGDTVAYNGFGFYTGVLGAAIFLLHGFILLSTFLPLTGGPNLIQKKSIDGVRYFATLQATILNLAALSVIANATLDFTRMEIRFGMYVSLIGSLVATLYAYLKYQDKKKIDVQNLFHQNDAHTERPRPPTPPSAEQHRPHRS
ncbi:MAG: hypothetical protein O2904_00555 [bacterium]|nr:hypothetical protein [bacterium]